ncbi:MAG: beta strand repeat-containing protein, partial [Planctomycetaceae bacterium]
MGTHGGDGFGRGVATTRERLTRTTASRWLVAATIATVFAALGGSEASAQLYWNTNGTSGTITAANWSTGTTGPYTTAWSASSAIVFTANSAITYATTPVGNLTILNSSTVTWTGGGTYGTGGAIRTFDIGAGSVLTWSGQSVATAAGTGFIKNGAGTWNVTSSMGSNAAPGGFTLNAGRMIVSSANSLGNGPLTINGGVLEMSGNNSYNATSLVIGGDFTLEGSGSSVLSKNGSVSLGSATRTITNNFSGNRQITGTIAGNAGVGLTFTGTGAGTFYLANTSNSFSGPVTVNSGEVVFNDNGSLGVGNIVLDGGRITSGTMTTAGVASALTNATIDSAKTISVSGSAGNAIGVQSSGGVLTFNGVIADKAGSTGSWTKAGSGRLTLGGQSTYTGSTAITNGTLQLASGTDRLPTTTVVSLGQAASSNLGTLDLNGNSQQVAGLASTAGSNSGANKNTVTSSAAATLTINVASGTYSYGVGTAANSGVITGAVSVVKSG